MNYGKAFGIITLKIFFYIGPYLDKINIEADTKIELIKITKESVAEELSTVLESEKVVNFDYKLSDLSFKYGLNEKYHHGKSGFGDKSAFYLIGYAHTCLKDNNKTKEKAKTKEEKKTREEKKEEEKEKINCFRKVLGVGEEEINNTSFKFRATFSEKEDRTKMTENVVETQEFMLELKDDDDSEFEQIFKLK
ncbi:hypothetical protein CDIK_2646 [Cucumispora dikerogammari]|nr:hypothetical protein CDIK_2646 [Cucumispora dikerogammari]